MQVRALCKQMIDDPLNPLDESFRPALSGTGTDTIWQGPPTRRLVVVQPQLE